jgi:hypothetical protein
LTEIRPARVGKSTKSRVAVERNDDVTLHFERPLRRGAHEFAPVRGAKAEGLIEMAIPGPILPRADSACGKVFFSDRRTADGHRIALEIWNQATGRIREGHRLAVYRCRRCMGFHIGYRPVDRRPIKPERSLDPADDPESFERDYAPVRVGRISRCGLDW